MKAITTTQSLAAEGADVRGMFDRVAKRYDAANRVMSAGIDVLWRKKAIRWLAQDAGPDAADPRSRRRHARRRGRDRAPHSRRARRGR